MKRTILIASILILCMLIAACLAGCQTALVNQQVIEEEAFIEPLVNNGASYINAYKDITMINYAEYLAAPEYISY